MFLFGYELYLVMQKAQGSLEYLIILAAVLALAVVIVLLAGSWLGTPIESATANQDKNAFAVNGIEIRGYDKAFVIGDTKTLPDSLIKDGISYVYAGEYTDKGKLVGEITDENGDTHNVYVNDGNGYYVGGSGSSSTSTPTPTPIPTPTCTDVIQNQGESDVDCGGPCQTCINGKTCVLNADCTSDFCNGTKYCDTPVASTCGNGICEAGEDTTNCVEDCGIVGANIFACGVTIPSAGAYVIASDLTCSGVDGILIEVDDVTIDGQNQIMTGPGISSGKIALKIRANNVVVKNINITNFNNAVNALSVNNVTITNIIANKNNNPFYLGSVDGAVVTNNIANENSKGFTMQTVTNAVIEDNIAVDNKRDAYYLDRLTHSNLTRNVGNRSGIYGMSGSGLTNVEFKDNTFCDTAGGSGSVKDIRCWGIKPIDMGGNVYATQEYCTGFISAGTC